MINPNEQEYLRNLSHVFENGHERTDRTGVGTTGIFGAMLRYDISEDFPLLTTKKMDIRSVASELLWFLEGSTDERRLAEIRYGKPRAELVGKKTIWSQNATSDYWRDRGLATSEGDLGRVYGAQWREWRTMSKAAASMEVMTIDQIDRLIEGLKKDPYGRRHIVSAWNPGEINQMALPPCHIGFQCYVQGKDLSLKWSQRSVDKFLGEPYNIASYALLARMIAQVCKYQTKELIHDQGDSHIYLNHRDAVSEQLGRTPFKAPRLLIDPSVKHIDDFKLSSFELVDYEYLPAIAAPMAV